MPSKQAIRLAPKLAMPLDAVTRTFGIFGQRETGKSTTGAVLVEQIVRAGARAVVLDPTGVWYGLTRAGTKPGLPGVVLGGEQSDAPLEPHSGGIVAEFVIASDYPLVVLDLKLMRKHQRQHFAMEFLEALYHDNREPLLVVFDEAAQFAPQQMREGGEVPRLLGAVEDLVKLGRSRGLGAAMIEQRIATLNANVREQIGTLVAHRLVGPLDRKALREWINANGEPEREAEALAVIPKLDSGQALVWSPAWIRFFGLVSIDNATTFDSRATPEVGKARKAPGARAPVNLDTLREQMASAIEEKRASDPKLLREELQRARVRIADLEARVPEQVEPERVEVPVFSDQDREALDTLGTVIDAYNAAVVTALDRAREVLADARAKAEEPTRAVVAAIARRPVPVPVPPRAEEERRARSNGSVSVPQQKILDALRWYEALGVQPVTRAQVALAAGYSHNSGGFGNLLSKLRTADLIDYPSVGLLALTAEGRAHATDPDMAQTDESVQAEVLRRLPKPQAGLLRVLIECYPRTLRREELAEATGYSATSGGFGNLLSKLRTAALIDYPTTGSVVASDVLFPVGGW